MTVRLWDIQGVGAAPAGMGGLTPRQAVRVWDHHTEFAVGLDFNVLNDGMVASAGWDEAVYVWHVSGAP
jgi:peroxin-7